MTSIGSIRLRKAAVVVLVVLACLAILDFNRIRAIGISNLPRAMMTCLGQKTENSQDDAFYLIPKDIILEKLTEEDLMRIYWKYINTVQILCRTHTRVGALGDGGKEMCVDPNYLPSSPCIVYSFGSNFQFDFDIPMNEYYGCEVFTYDPSMNITGKTLPSQIKFELRGIADRDYINDKKWTMSTLETIMKGNGHLNKTIDVLKIDVEGGEWSGLPPFIDSGLHRNVKQMLIEVHVGRVNTTMPGYWGDTTVINTLRVLRLLYESGFKIFMREHNLAVPYTLNAPPNNNITSVNELSMLNTRFIH